MNLRSTGFVGSLVLVTAPMAYASPAETTPVVTPSPATMATPVQPMPAAEAAKATPAVPPSAATQPAAPAASAPPVPAADTAAVRKTAIGLGLKPRNKAGTEVYCKSAAEIGTRLPTFTCFTKEQVAELKKRTQTNQDDIATMQRASLTEPNGG